MGFSFLLAISFWVQSIYIFCSGSGMTIKDWLHRMHKEGIHRRYNKKQPGRPKKLTDEQLEDLKKTFQILHKLYAFYFCSGPQS